jgi:predicted RND superfamily exporter protein
MPRFALILMLAAAVTGAQKPATEPEMRRLPDGRSQAEAIVKEDHERSLKDAAELVKLAEELKEELEKNDRHVISVGSIKKTEEIEKLAKRIRSRMKRF